MGKWGEFHVGVLAVRQLWLQVGRAAGAYHKLGVVEEVGQGLRYVERRKQQVRLWREFGVRQRLYGECSVVMRGVVGEGQIT